MHSLSLCLCRSLSHFLSLLYLSVTWSPKLSSLCFPIVSLALYLDLVSLLGKQRYSSLRAFDSKSFMFLNLSFLEIESDLVFFFFFFEIKDACSQSLDIDYFYYDRKATCEKKQKKTFFFPQSNTDAIVEIGYLLLDQIPTYRCKEYLCLNNKLPDREALKPHRHMVLFT